MKKLNEPSSFFNVYSLLKQYCFVNGVFVHLALRVCMTAILIFLQKIWK